MKNVTKIILGLGLTMAASVAMAQCDNTNLSAWSMASNPANKMNVTATAAMGGTACGLEMEVIAQTGGQASRHFVQDSSPNSETRYRAAFCIDPNSTTMPSTGPNRRLKVQQAQCAGGLCDNSDVVQFKLQHDGTNYQLDTWVRDANLIPPHKNRHFLDIPDAPTRVEYDVDLTNGTFKVWINATSESDPRALELTGLDTSNWSVITRARLGSMDRSTRVTQGDIFYLDEFESRRQTFIGGTCN